MAWDRIGVTEVYATMDISDELKGIRQRIDHVDQSLGAAIEGLRLAQADFHEATGARIRQLERTIDAAFEGETAEPSGDLRSFPYALRPDYQLFLGYFITHGGLRRDHSVLDVGCGRGRMARELLTYLGPTARYEGFDVRGAIIKELQRAFSTRYPHFNFHHTNIWNKRYNPEGTVAAREYVFPFEDDTFNFVFLLSIFTHVLPGDMEHYLAEIARVLKTGSRCLITYFLLNDESLRLVESGVIRKTFRHRSGPFRFENADEPEAAVAIEEDFVRGLYKRLGLKIIEPIYYGNWCCRPGPEMRQDMIVAVKE